MDEGFLAVAIQRGSLFFILFSVITIKQMRTMKKYESQLNLRRVMMKKT